MVATMLGIAIALAMEHFFGPESPFEWAHVFAFLGIFMTAIVFALGMMGLARDGSYWNYLAAHHGLAAYDLFSDMASGLVLVYMALNLCDPKPLILSNAVLRVLDILAELLVVGPAEEASGRKRESVDAWTWLFVDLFAILVLIVAWWGVQAHSWDILTVSLLFLGYTLVDVCLDLPKNSDFYFGLPGSRESS
jgi:hypothetical protein